MFGFLFWTLVRHVGVPIIVILVFWDQFGSPQITYAVIAVILTITTVFTASLHLIRLIPNLAFLRQKKLIKLILELVIEVGAVIGFWLGYLVLFY